MDYWALNQITAKDRYPMPLMTDVIEQVGKAQYFTAIDLRSAFHRIRVKEGDEWKTVFWTRLGQFEYVVMPFGLCNAPSIFQRMMDGVFRDFLGKFMAIWIDDIVVYSDNEEDH